MSRLWDKGAPLDERVLRFTAGEDFSLDERLIAYDIRASIAHAEMLLEQGLLARADLEAIRGGLTALGQAHAQGQWHVELPDEDGHTALERRLTERIGPAGAGPSWALAQRSGARCPAALSARCARGPERRRDSGRARPWSGSARAS
ncbi:argininosuccinate lyase, partial [mine drainage metagenome]